MVPIFWATLYIAPKSTNESGAHYAPESAWGARSKRLTGKTCSKSRLVSPGNYFHYCDSFCRFFYYGVVTLLVVHLQVHLSVLKMPLDNNCPACKRQENVLLILAY